MEIAITVLSIVIILLTIALTILVLMQSGKGKELSGAIAGGSSNSYLGNSKTNDKDKLLVGITCAISVVLTLCVLALYVITLK